MSSATADPDKMFRIIKCLASKASTRFANCILDFNISRECTASPDAIEWQHYYEDLAHPKCSETYNEEMKIAAKMKHLLMSLTNSQSE